MGQLKSMDLPERGSPATTDASAAKPAKRRWWIWALVIAGVVVAIWYFRGSRNPSQAADPSAPAGSRRGRGGAGGGGSFVVPVVVAAAHRGDLPVYFNGLGNVTAYNTVTVRSRVDGQIVNVAFKEGQYVHVGDLLVQIDPRPFQVQLEQAQGQLAKDQAQRKDAQVNLERFQLLFKEGVIPQQQLDTQAALVGQFDGAITSDQSQIDNAKLQLSFSHVTAPISGRVGLRLIDPGNIVHATDVNGLVLITQLQPIAVLFSLPQDQLPQVNAKLRAGVQLTVEAFNRDNTEKIATGKLLTIDNQIDTATGTYRLKSVFDNSDNVLFPNQFVNVRLFVDTKHGLTIVPSPAIQRGPQGTFVYIVGSDNTAKIRPVTIALTTGNSIGLSSGLDGGDVVVIDGQDKLQDGSRVNPTMTTIGTSGSAGPPSSPAPAPASPGAPAPEAPSSSRRARGSRR
ncbi:MAG TPA: MdtA/MuxA family multidrug efflux RND transporter periplasmic adaptor subunit [Candidatus Acidoferrum sp.]|jgi:multidrug efflux system membrane fusion protein|nr:MdtA/MuxA family multidrug efflux RND transporter periplasmic adaptor subunit [Candidatus Acidoferrum sp.]